jgi:hypothetical protein
VLKLLVKRHRDLGQLKSKSACRLHALLMELEPGGMAKEMTVTRANEILLDQVVDQEPDHPASPRGRPRVRRGHRSLRSTDEGVDEAASHCGRRVRDVADDIRGVGVVVAALIIGHTGDVSRFASAGTSRATTRPPRSKRHRVSIAASSQPSRQPAAQLRDPHRRNHTAAPPVRRTRVLRPSMRRGQELQGSHPGAEAPHLQLGLPALVADARRIHG